MQAFDKINNRYGRETIKLCCGLGSKPANNEAEPWQTKRDYLSPCYTTKITDIPVVY
jgi:DNA polymerase V